MTGDGEQGETAGQFDVIYLLNSCDEMEDEESRARWVLVEQRRSFLLAACMSTQSIRHRRHIRPFEDN
jgi:hypothetical protein